MMHYKDNSDQFLLILLKEGDHYAYTELYNRYSGVLYAHALRRLKNREEAKDIIHELFTYLWVNRSVIEIQGQLSGYLYTSVRNRVIKVVSHKVVASKYIDMQQLKSHCDFSSDYLIRENQLNDIIEKEINSLPPRMQEIFILSRRGYLTHREIAYELNISELTVKKQVTNALKLLRTRLDLFVKLFFLITFL